MAPGPGRTLRRRKLGKELQRLKEVSGQNLSELARNTGLGTSALSKIFNGRTAILARNVRLICQACGVGAPTMDTLIRLAEESDDRGWWVAYSDTVPDWFATYVDLESDATVINAYSAELVDGLLQIPEYAEAVMRAGVSPVNDESLRRAVELRRARQAILDRAKPPQLNLVLNEAAVIRPTGGRAVQARQLEHLVLMAQRPNIRLQILPFAVGEHPGMKGPFTLLRFPDDYRMSTASMDCVYLENANGEMWQERLSDIERYVTTFDRLQALSLSPENTVEAISKLASDTRESTREG
ncbi:helix-turn-helix domain-containing protein [Labedaea rhizosphaerae]|uniref:Helix-turn-helix protein n=1 Tax=Labedaea rhizosphaerae TaxID=598644 RepID=A0A4V3CZE3_LABRH|nr:helix-turn-helix transcriptional regulator [Labedaea rhizosphaerae]TDP97628.1 helix-turn-helix protein [Labedaea rhizosphaerae]